MRSLPPLCYVDSHLWSRRCRSEETSLVLNSKSRLQLGATINHNEN